jgi:acetyl esterase/lipase
MTAPVVIFVMAYADSSPITKGPLKELGQYVSWGRLTAAAGLIAVTYQTERADDIEALVAYIHKHADGLHMDPDRIGLWSCSGNCLAAVSFAMQKDRDYLKFAVFYYGLMLTPDNWLRKEINGLCAPRGCYAAELKDIAYIRTDLPLLVVKAGLDAVPYVNDSIDHFVGLAKEEHAVLTFVEFENAVHGFDIEQKSDPKASEIVRQTLEFIKKYAAGRTKD